MASTNQFTEEGKKKLWKVISWVNEQDLFWLHELRTFMECKNSDTYEDPNNITISRAIQRLKKLGYIQCCDRKGPSRQYIVVKRANITTIFIQ